MTVDERADLVRKLRLMADGLLAPLPVALREAAQELEALNQERNRPEVRGLYGYCSQPRAGDLTKRCGGEFQKNGACSTPWNHVGSAKPHGAGQ